jgi:Mrp family chromosome partitioning ATPase
VKGGVGRSTALAIAAADLAAQGRNVLALDLDLEAPGLGAFLLTREEMPKYGATDWFAAVAAGADAESLIPDMTGASPFTSAQAVVDVVPAAGRDPGAYLSKLARAYTPGSAGDRYSALSFSKKADALIAQLASRQRYDAVLIDARAGLHETSGGLILGVGAKALLFGIDTPQTFDDFRLLFGALAEALDPAIDGEDLRPAFKMVHATSARSWSRAASM